MTSFSLSVFDPLWAGDNKIIPKDKDCIDFWKKTLECGQASELYEKFQQTAQDLLFRAQVQTVSDIDIIAFVRFLCYIEAIGVELIEKPLYMENEEQLKKSNVESAEESKDKKDHSIQEKQKSSEDPMDSSDGKTEEGSSKPKEEPNVLVYEECYDDDDYQPYEGNLEEDAEDVLSSQDHKIEAIKFPCSECDEGFLTTWDYDIHFYTKHTPKPKPVSSKPIANQGEKSKQRQSRRSKKRKREDSPDDSKVVKNKPDRKFQSSRLRAKYGFDEVLNRDCPAQIRDLSKNLEETTDELLIDEVAPATTKCLKGGDAEAANTADVSSTVGKETEVVEDTELVEENVVAEDTDSAKNTESLEGADGDAEPASASDGSAAVGKDTKVAEDTAVAEDTESLGGADGDAEPASASDDSAAVGKDTKVVEDTDVAEDTAVAEDTESLEGADGGGAVDDGSSTVSKDTDIADHTRSRKPKRGRPRGSAGLPKTKRAYPCQICLEQIYGPDFKQHMIEVHQVNSEMRCLTCNRVFYSHNMLLEHVERHRARNLKKFTCSICGKNLKNVYLLEYHEKAHSKPEKCSLCQKTFSTPGTLKRHMTVHTQETRFKCQYCPKEFYHSNKCKKHEASHEERTYKCTKCDLAFHFKSGLDSHMYTHDPNRQLVHCDICQKSFKAKGNLSTHIRQVHQKQKTHPCTICGVKFGKMSTRKRHEATHTDVKPYQCELCGKSFREKGHLRRHVEWHKGEQKHMCDVCGRLFAFKDNMLKHRRIHTGETPYSCDLCAQTFSYIEQLKKHKKKLHTVVMSDDVQYETTLEIPTCKSDQVPAPNSIISDAIQACLSLDIESTIEIM